MTCRTHQRNVAKNTVIILLIIRLTFHNLLSTPEGNRARCCSSTAQMYELQRMHFVLFFGQLLCAIEMTLAGGNSLGTEGS